MKFKKPHFWDYKKKLTTHEKEGIQFDRNLFKKDYEDLVKKYLVDFIKEAEESDVMPEEKQAALNIATS